MKVFKEFDWNQKSKFSSQIKEEVISRNFARTSSKIQDSGKQFFRKKVEELNLKWMKEKFWKY